ncbi:putative bifunctional diguanylate cyclase/phosphodiesterase [Shewanella violacea]|uniref:Sensory box/GGDEF family protein n=1 Tax=Shewanella violacea (strain JCM 10179 / CIP 106290 / LMG 19151 / DSS12) TaxID=637905 RepID=D4ZCY0_SHEVD|nr:EAL domain-containing protein [Shewanella violacea]BAJ03875.1 sensory box/GGDEF family protein [Shewanella violacea DSS12]
MHIGKKLIVFVVGFCIPAMIAVSYCSSIWFDHRIESLKLDLVSTELVSIKSQLDKDIKQLDLFANIYAAPQSELSSLKRAALAEAWRTSKISEHLRVYHLDGGQLKLFSPRYDDPMSFELNSIPGYLLHGSSPHSGVYMDKGIGYIVSVVPNEPDSPVMLVRRLTPEYLSSYALQGLVSQVIIAQGVRQANPLRNTSVIELPSLIYDKPVHLEITFSDSVFSQGKLQHYLVPFCIVCVGILILIAGYIWLNLGLIRPFHRLMTQLEGINPKAKTYTPLIAGDSPEFVLIADRVNHLLAKIVQLKEHAKSSLGSISEAVILTDAEAKLVYLNPLAERLLGVKGPDVLGEKVDVLLKTDRNINQDLFDLMASRARQPILSKLKLQGESTRIVERSISTRLNHKQLVVGTVILLRDITQEELLKRKLHHRVNLDPITSLLNRRAFEDKLEAFSLGAQSIAICYFDLEQFKLINDSCGHSAGDRMLVMVARAMQSCLTQDQMLARFGGDEFGLAIRDHSALEVAQLTKRIVASVSMQVLQDKNNACHYKVGVSAGIAIARAPYISEKELLKDADIACFAAKGKGSNQVHFYDDKDKDLIFQRNAPMWAVRIGQAIEHNELLLYYQPIKGVGPGKHRQRMEILLRIQEPNGRILAPAQFIAAAEQFKLMSYVDKEVIRKAFLWLSMHEEIWEDHCISINLSGNSLGAEGMVDYIIQQFERFAIPSECICFEITETSAIQNKKRAMEMLEYLRKLGFSFALDDFGSGFASYGYLKELPVDYVKIDGCFVKNLATNAKDYAIVKSIHDICGVMGIETVAEFVENQDIIDKLQEIGINYAQGYAIGRPQPLSSYQPSQSVSRRLIA